MRFVQIFPAVAWQGSKSSEIVIVGLEVLDLARSAAYLCFSKGGRNLTNDATDNLILQIEDVLQCAIKAICPQVRARLGIDELGQ